MYQATNLPIYSLQVCSLFASLFCAYRPPFMLAILQLKQTLFRSLSSLPWVVVSFLSDAVGPRGSNGSTSYLSIILLFSTFLSFLPLVHPFSICCMPYAFAFLKPRLSQVTSSTFRHYFCSFFLLPPLSLFSENSGNRVFKKWSNCGIHFLPVAWVSTLFLILLCAYICSTSRRIPPKKSVLRSLFILISLYPFTLCPLLWYVDTRLNISLIVSWFEIEEIIGYMHNYICFISDTCE